MKVLHIEGRGMIEGEQWEEIRKADVVIMNGVLVKNLNGKTGMKVGGAIFIWDERPYAEHDRTGKEAVSCGDIAGWGDGDIRVSTSRGVHSSD